MNNETSRKRIASLYGRPGTSFSQDLDAIFAEFVVIPRADLPEVKAVGSDFLDVAGVTFTGIYQAEDSRRRGMRLLAIAEYLEAKEASDAEAKTKRNTRRDELARELTVEDPYIRYDDLISFGKAAIDRIIELEEAAK